MKRKYLFLLILPLLVFGFILIGSLGVKAQSTTAQDVCPDGGDWHKVEAGDPNFLSYTADEGYIVTAICAKGGSENSQGGYLVYMEENGTYNVGEQVCLTFSGIGTQTGSVSRNTNLEGNVCSELSHASFKVGEAEEIEENPILTLTSICRDDINQERRWRVFHEDESDLFYPVTLGYEIYPGSISEITTSFTFNYTKDNRFSNPYIFTTPLTGESQTIKLYWYNKETGKWVEDDTKAANNDPCYVFCVETKEEIGDWSDWQVDPLDPAREYSERTISYYDATYTDHFCESKIETMYQDIQEEPETPEESEIPEEPETPEEAEIPEEADILEDPETPVEEDTPDVLGESTGPEEVGVVLAETGATSNILVYVIQAILTLSTIFSGIFFSKKYIM